MNETEPQQKPPSAPDDMGKLGVGNSDASNSRASKSGMDVRIEGGVTLNERQLRTRNARSVAIALSLGALVILFYIVTLVKGPGVLVRPL